MAFNKEAFLKALREDEEFRYAVLGLLGIDKILQSIDENTKAIKSLQEQVKTLQKQVRTLQVQVSKHAKILERHTKAIVELTSKINALGTRWGVVSEEAFRESIKYLVEDLLRAYKVSRWTYFDKDGAVYGHPSYVEVDVLVRDNEHVLVEFKSYADKPDVAELYRIGKLYEKVSGVKPRLLIVASAIRKRAKELADQLEVECRGAVLDY
ncbi:MAG: DUF3782 domain-containing protein [Pyrobaculum sp.]